MNISGSDLSGTVTPQRAAPVEETTERERERDRPTEDIAVELHAGSYIITAFRQLDFPSSVLRSSDVTHAELTEATRRLLFTGTRARAHARTQKSIL